MDYEHDLPALFRLCVVYIADFLQISHNPADGRVLLFNLRHHRQTFLKTFHRNKQRRWRPTLKVHIQGLGSFFTG